MLTQFGSICTFKKNYIELRGVKTKKPSNFLKGLSLLCGLVAIRTQDLLLRRQLLYPAELRNRYYLNFKKNG